MGRDKALLPHPDTGTSLLARQAALLQSVGCSELLLAAPVVRDYSLPGARRIDDAAPDCGPLGGLVAGLTAAAHPRLLVLAVDLPRVETQLLRRLLAAATPHIGAVPLDPQGRPEPLCAVYPTARTGLFRDALTANRLALRPLLGQGLADGWLSGFETEPGLLANWNSPADLA